jgi:hypothetical protein
LQSGKASIGETSKLLNDLMNILNLKELKISKYFLNIYTSYTDKTLPQNIDVCNGQAFL